jgi:hypothetical protein
MNISDAQLAEWNRRGLIPGPEESEDQYYERVQHCLNVRHELQLDPAMVEKHAEEALAEPLERAGDCFDIAPDWIPFVYGNKHLMPWHGGCAWIFQMAEGGPLAAFIQLRSAFLASRYYLGFYDRNELVAHELAHACRMAFQEPAFEEVLAYSCSSRSYTRILGPIVESSIESAVFMLALAIVIAVEMVTLFYGLEGDGSLLLGLLALPLAMAAYGGFRLWRKLSAFNSCKDNLTKTLNDPQKVRGLMFRLTDAEIRAFASMSKAEILNYADEHREQSMRWRVIHLAYLSTSKS